MSARLDLADPRGFDTPRDYIEKHLAPVATELQRLVNEFLSPGASTSEAWEVDMSPHRDSAGYANVTELLQPPVKSAFFDGREYFSIPRETLVRKRLKVQLVAVAYVKNGGSASFRLVRGDGGIIPDSEFQVASGEPTTVTRILPFGEGAGCVLPHNQQYIMQAKRLEKHSLPVCRRFSLSFICI